MADASAALQSTGQRRRRGRLRRSQRRCSIATHGPRVGAPKRGNRRATTVAIATCYRRAVLGRVLHPLDRRQQSLLLTAMSFGGSEARELWKFLPDDDGRAIAAKAATLEDIPREKRVPLMVRELRGLMSFRAVKGLDGVEPSWLAAAFKGESPRVIAAVLMYLPSSLSRQIIARLPDGVQKALPAREALKDVPMEVIKLVRSRFDQKFVQMPLERDLSDLGFEDVVLLSAKELITLVRSIGADEIACAFLAVGKRALAEFLTKLAPQDGEELLAAVRRSDVKDGMELKAAQAFLGKVLTAAPSRPGTGTSPGIRGVGGNTSGMAFANTDELFQKGGLYRLARALSVEDETAVRQLVQRFPRAHGRLLLEYIERVRERDNDDAAVRRLRDQIIAAVANLSQRGKIDGRYGAVATRYEAR